MGEAPVLAHGDEEAHPVGRDPHLSRATLTGKFLPQGEDEELEALRWIIFDNQKVNGFLGPYRFLKNFAKPAGDPAVLAFFKGRIDGNLGIVNKRLEGRQFLLGDRPTIADVSLAGYLYYPAEEFGFDIGKDHPAIARLARAHEGAAGLEASLRPDAGPSAAGVSYQRAVSPPSMTNSAPVTNADSSDSR